MGWENPHTTPGNFVQFALHGRDQFVFVLVKHRPPLFFRLQVDEEFGIKKARWYRFRHPAARFGWCTAEPREKKQSMMRAWFATRMPSSGPVLGASVPRTQSAPSSR
jgi:hypothetical protein